MRTQGVASGDHNRRLSPLDKLRRRVGWTYERLAEEADMSPFLCRRVLKGESVTTERVAAIKAALKRGNDPEKQFAQAIAGARFEDARLIGARSANA